MVEESSPFQRLIQALAHLSNDELLSLLRAIDGLMHKASSDPTLRGRVFQAHGSFYRQPLRQQLSFQDILPLIDTLNPAELQVLHTLAPYYFDRMRYADGQQVSATWGSTNPFLGFASNVVASSPAGVSQDEQERRTEQFKASVNLLKPAQEAKAAGDDKQAAELFDQVFDLLKQQGITGPMLEYLRTLFQN